MSKINEKIVIKGGYIRTGIDNIHEHNQRLNSGTGVHRSKKGKGSYTRKEKYKTKYI